MDASVADQTQKTRRLPRLRMQRYAGWVMYFWHGMRVRTWFGLLRRNRYRTTLNCVPQVVTVSLTSVLNSVLYRVSELVFAKRADAVVLDPPPVFVIGHWRTGTTYLHDLLACDPELGHPTTYQVFLPNHFLLTERLARFWFKLLLPKKRPQDDVAVKADRPQEEELALVNMGLRSFYLTWAMPRRGPVDEAYIDLRDLTETERRAWTDGLLWFLRRVTLRQNKRLVLKTPQHTARLRTLIELFPGARFIHLARDPLTVFPSTVRLFKSLNSIQGLQNPPYDDPWLEGSVLRTFMRLFRCYEEDRGLIPKGQLIEVKYEELAADPKSLLRRIYDELDLGDFARAEAAVDDYLAGTKDYRTNAYELPLEKRKLVRARWGPYIDRFGYREAVERAVDEAEAEEASAET